MSANLNQQITAAVQRQVQYELKKASSSNIDDASSSGELPNMPSDAQGEKVQGQMPGPSFAMSVHFDDEGAAVAHSEIDLKDGSVIPESGSFRK